MEVASDPLAVLDQRQRMELGVQPGVLDRHAGGSGEADDELLVHIGEHLGGGLVGEIEVAEHVVPHAYRHAEERTHRRMVRREAVAVRMLREVREAQGLGVDDQEPEDAVAPWQRPDRTVGLVIDTDRDELGQARP